MEELENQKKKLLLELEILELQMKKKKLEQDIANLGPQYPWKYNPNIVPNWNTPIVISEDKKPQLRPNIIGISPVSSFLSHGEIRPGVRCRCIGDCGHRS